MAIKYTANVIRQIKSGATTYDLQDATLKPFVEQLLSDVASIKGVYTEEQANAHNAELDGAIPNTGEATFSAAQAEAYNNAIDGASVQQGDTITPEQANLYNATLAGAVEAGAELDDDSVVSVKTLSDDLETLEGDVEEHARVTAAALTDLDSRIDAIEAVNVTTEKMDAWDAKYDKPGTGIPATDLASAVQTSLGKADSAVQSVAEGATNGTIAVDGTDVAVHGLGSAAYTASTAYDAAGDAAAVLGTSGDAATANTVYGAKAAVAAVLGASGDAATANTVYGAKAYADSLVGTMPTDPTTNQPYTDIIDYIDSKTSVDSNGVLTL